MSTAAGPSLGFPKDFKPDTRFVTEALGVFLRQSGYSANLSFADLTLSEQSVVLRMAQLLKREEAK